ncbi:MAG: tRNA (5-methylaminomethyl-2-thiouridine)(34)-methyltransferase MnmD [Bacteroidota bacterium]
MSLLRIIETGDGSHTLLNTALDETYHSRHGAVQESVHMFINNGLRHRLNGVAIASINILEIGLGTGLNAWLTMLEADKHPAIQFHYTGLEPYPVEESVLQQLNYTQPDETKQQVYFEAIHRAATNQTVALTNNFVLHKQLSEVQHIEQQQHYDVIYFDAFAPNKQPELWEKPIIERVTAWLNPSGVWVTYSAKGQLKRDLKSLGLQVETLPGPPGKAEMVRATNTTQ